MSEIEALTNCGAIVKLSVMCGLCRYDLVLFSGLIYNAVCDMDYYTGTCTCACLRILLK